MKAPHIYSLMKAPHIYSFSLVLLSTIATIYAGYLLAADNAELTRQLRTIRAEAVALGHAEYVITDNATGRTEFRWKEVKK
jgi:hypothetical protein